ncbi:T6SS effector amidase Tae4 family protein [Enterovibrio makurazakiensis]|uniref:T6SS effector amidase Tae4 family protein n=1 Tax=Enterovibrio makurazakiensis TaxID=2910232 RepID=UPI003D1F21BD
MSPKDLYSGIDGKKGIIFFKDYWLRGSSRTGDHIDLWDGNELASLGYLQSHIRRWFPSFSEDYLGMSDFERCKSILFWEMT